MTDTILAGVDGRPEHRATLDWASARAARDAARLDLVSVIERSWGDPPDEPGRLLELAAESLLAAERTIALHHAREVDPASDITVTTRFRYGHVGHELAETSREADLLVVGSPFCGDGPHFSGSLAVRVAAAAACPVAVVPHGWEDSGAGVVVGVDGQLASEPAVLFAADEATALGEPLTIVCAGFTANPLLAGLVPEVSLGDHRRRILEEAARAARERHPGLAVRTEQVEEAPARGLVEAAAGARMLAIGTHDRHGMRRLALGSVSHDVLLNVRCPVVVVRPRGEEGSR